MWSTSCWVQITPKYQKLRIFMIRKAVVHVVNRAKDDPWCHLMTRSQLTNSRPMSILIGPCDRFVLLALSCTLWSALIYSIHNSRRLLYICDVAISCQQKTFLDSWRNGSFYKPWGCTAFVSYQQSRIRRKKV